MTDVDRILARDCRDRPPVAPPSPLLGVVVGVPLGLLLWAVVLRGVWLLLRGAS